MTRRPLILGLAAALAVSGCGGQAGPAGDDELTVVATTPILADIAREVAGERAEVVSLVPPGTDPHTHELSLRDVRTISRAEVALSNYLMLEPHSLIKTLDASLPAEAVNVSIAEEAAKHGATTISLVENANLDTLWLGLRVAGSGAQFGADRASEVELRLESVAGPGQFTGYLAGTFGEPRVFFSDHDGVDSRNSSTLPANAHTHMSWAFAEGGVYEVRFGATLRTADGEHELDPGTLTIAVGADPRGDSRFAGRTVLERGHADLTANLDAGRVDLYTDAAGEPASVDLDDVVVWVPPKAIAEIPASPAYRFLGRPGTDLHQLPQAVLGAHVHGEIDPHLWHSVPNVKAYVAVVEETLAEVDPEGAAHYRGRARAYSARLDDVDRYVAGRIGSIPEARRHLITTHDAYGYLAETYGLTVAGVVAPNPSVEPSLASRRKLSETIASLAVPAVFLEPTVARDSSVLATVAAEHGVRVCPLYGDTLDADVPTYLELMRFNADSLADCLS